MATVGCDDKHGQAAAAGFDAPAHARRVAEERILARVARPGAVLRAMQVYRQAAPQTIAVCGQVNPSGRGDSPYIPFVTVLTYEGDPPAAGGEPRFQFAQYLADSSPAATRVYVEMVSRCFEGGGTRDARQVPALPPLPDGLQRQAEDPPPAAAALPSPAPAAPAPGQAPAAMVVASPSSRSSVTTRQHANLRTSPSGGSVVRVVPPGSSLTVFGEAPGGWYQVGESEPQGWIHGSMLGGP
ncbi:MAG TPA: SH3 domain-containing protein [Roseomonas sp.]